MPGRFGSTSILLLEGAAAEVEEEEEEEEEDEDSVDATSEELKRLATLSQPVPDTGGGDGREGGGGVMDDKADGEVDSTVAEEEAAGPAPALSGGNMLMLGTVCCGVAAVAAVFSSLFSLSLATRSSFASSFTLRSLSSAHLATCARSSRAPA